MHEHHAVHELDTVGLTRPSHLSDFSEHRGFHRGRASAAALTTMADARPSREITASTSSLLEALRSSSWLESRIEQVERLTVFDES